MRSILSFLFVCFLLALVPIQAFSSENIASRSELEARHDAFLKWREDNTSNLEFFIESKPMDDGAETNIALTIHGIDLDVASEALNGPAAWCELLFLHLNIKACVYGNTGERQWIRLYMGRKFYQDAEDAEMIELDFVGGVTDDNVSWASLTADEGPYNTSDYFVGLSAIRVGDDIYAELSSSQKAGAAVGAAMDLYFDTLARNKVGFSVVGKTWSGKPKYAGGAQGMLERNVVRYLLALRAFMLTHTETGYPGMRTRAALWYDATGQYPEQLYEVERDDYLRDKEKEYKQQLRMQSEID